MKGVAAKAAYTFLFVLGAIVAGKLCQFAALARRSLGSRKAAKAQRGPDESLGRAAGVRLVIVTSSPEASGSTRRGY